MFRRCMAWSKCYDMLAKAKLPFGSPSKVTSNLILFFQFKKVALEAVWFLYTLLYISPFASCQALPSWSAFHRSLPCLSSVPPTVHSTQPALPVSILSNVNSNLPTVDSYHHFQKQLEIHGHSQPLIPRWSHADSIRTLLLTESKLSLSKSFKDQFKAPSFKISWWFCFSLNFYLFYMTRQHLWKQVISCVCLHSCKNCYMFWDMAHLLYTSFTLSQWYAN